MKNIFKSIGSFLGAEKGLLSIVKAGHNTISSKRVISLVGGAAFATTGIQLIEKGIETHDKYSLAAGAVLVVCATALAIFLKTKDVEAME
jgi:hypothetical protein